MALTAHEELDEENTPSGTIPRPVPPRPVPPRLVLTRPIVLVGLMGSGKSTIGKRLAHRLAVPFVDADDEIERAAGLSIAEIFAKLGEPVFRDGERRVLARLITDTPQVIATGGGAFINDETRQLILARSDAVWLDAPIDVLVERTARRNTRPLLQTGDPREILLELLDVRGPLYAQAPMHVASGRQSHDRMVDFIIDKMLARQAGSECHD
jgi:shikimate kinase